MNWLSWSCVAAASLAAAFVVYAVARKATKGKALDGFGCGILSLAAVAAVAVLAVRGWYADYGAFYDSSWKEPGVESHFLFRADDTEALQAIYDSSGGDFDFASYPVILVRLGCGDCESNEGRILAAKAEIEEKTGRPAYIVFSRSGIGRLYAEEYGVASVPVALIGDGTIELY